MNEINEIAKLIGSYGVSIIIVVIFLWDYIANKNKNLENQELIKNTLNTVDNTSVTIANCLKEMQQQNQNTTKTKEILQSQIESTKKKIDILLERRN